MRVVNLQEGDGSCAFPRHICPRNVYLSGAEPRAQPLSPHRVLGEAVSSAASRRGCSEIGFWCGRTHLGPGPGRLGLTLAAHAGGQGKMGCPHIFSPTLRSVTLNVPLLLEGAQLLHLHQKEAGYCSPATLYSANTPKCGGVQHQNSESQNQNLGSDHGRTFEASLGLEQRIILN